MTPDGPAVAIEPEQAAAIFAEFAAAEELVLEFPADGCYARTQLMVQWLLHRGLAPSKVWAFAASVADLLWTEAPDHPDGRVQWGYHVAPALFVRTPAGDTCEMVLDPLLFDRPGSRRGVADRASRHANPGADGTRGTAAARSRRDWILAGPRPPRRARGACPRDAGRVPERERLMRSDGRSSAMVKALTTGTTLRVVREVHEDESGAAPPFPARGPGRLAVGDANYATHLRLARRSQERQHPVGVSFGEGQTITEVIRADNDVAQPTVGRGARSGPCALPGPRRSFPPQTRASGVRPPLRRAGRGPSAEGPRLVHRPETRPGPAGCPAGRGDNTKLTRHFGSIRGAWPRIS